MPRLILTRALTHQHGGKTYKRGLPAEVSDQDYAYLIQKGLFRDPDQDIDFVIPSRLRAITTPMEIPVIRDMGMGDVLIVSVALRYLAKANRHLKFVYAVDSRYVPLFRDLDYVSRTVAIQTLRGAWPYGIDLRGYGERAPGCRTDDRLELYMRYLVGTTEVPDPHVDLYPTTEEVERGWRLSGQREGTPWVLHAIRASLGVRSWPMGYVETLAEQARDSGMGMVLVDPMRWPTTERLEAAGAVNLTGRTTVPDLLCLAAASSVVLAPDTGVVHLANAINKRCVTYFTTVPPVQRLKHARWARALWPRELDCLGCIHTPTCGKPDPKPCAMAVTPEDVMDEIRFVLANEPPWPLEAPRNWARPGRTGSRWLGTGRPTTGAAVEVRRARVTALAGR